MSERRRISQGSTFEEQVGYSRAMVDDPWVFVAGTTGFDYSTMTISDDIVEQVDQTLANIDAALAQAGASAADVVRARYYLPTRMTSRLAIPPFAATSAGRARRPR